MIGVYAAAVIKKRRYWPKYVPGEEINEIMKECKIGENKVMPDKLNNEKFNYFMMKEPAFVMKIMST